jgi:hypothetical protein
MIDQKLLEILACPKCKGNLIYNEEKNILICEKCKVYYEIIDEIPVLLVDEAKPLKNDDQ